MIENPHQACERVLNTLKVSGLTYGLTETPFSCNIELRKKYVKNFVPQPDFNVMNYDLNRTVNKTKQEAAFKSEQDNAKELRAVRDSIFDKENENTDRCERLGQPQCPSSVRKKSLTKESSIVKEESVAEICSTLKSRYDKLVLTSGQKIDSLNSASENTKAEMAAEIVKHEKCRTRVESLELLQCSSLARESDLASELLKVKEELTVEAEKCSFLASELLKVKEEFTVETEKCSSLKSDLTSELLSAKEELTAEKKKSSKMKSRYDQLALTLKSSLAREGDLTSELLSVKKERTAELKKSSTLKSRYDQLVLSIAAERTAETLKLEKSRKRVKTLSDEGVKLRKEHKDTIMSLESSLKSKNKGISKLEERVRVLQEETVTLCSTIRLLKISKVSVAPVPSEEPTSAASSCSYFTPLSSIFPLADLPTTPTGSSRATPERLSSHTSSSLDGDWRVGKLSLADCKIDYTQLHYNIYNPPGTRVSFCTHGPELRSVDSTFCDIVHCKDIYGEPDDEGCGCGKDTNGERYSWCTVCKIIVDDFSDSDGSSSDVSSSNTSPSQKGLLCTCIWECNSCGIIHENMPPGHKDDGGKYGECKPGVTIPSKCSNCLARESDPCKCQWQCDHCGGTADVEHIPTHWKLNHWKENDEKCEYRPEVTIPYRCIKCTERLNYLQFLKIKR